MPAFRFYQNQKAAAPEHLLTSPFSPGDRVNTVHGPGTIYQSGPYESWVVLDETWEVTHVWTDFVARLPGEPLEGLQAGHPTLDQLIQVGYKIRQVDTKIRTLAEAAERKEYHKDRLPFFTFRIAKVLPDSIDEYVVVAVTRDEIPAYQPQGVG
jgi:hypothetical protein